MRIVIDLQGAQTESRFRGIGRYSLSLAKAIVRNRGKNDAVIALSGLFPDTIIPIRREFDGLLPQGNIRVWYAQGPVFDIAANIVRKKVAEILWTHFIESLAPDIVFISSLFEREAPINIKNKNDSYLTVVTLYDLIPLKNPELYLSTNPQFEDFYMDKIEMLKQADGWAAISKFSRQEGIQTLQLPGKKIVNISTACDVIFQNMNSTSGVSLSKFGIKKAFILYTGGADKRKNLLKLIYAFALLPPNIRQSYQLVMVGKIPDVEVVNFKNHAKNVGLQDSEYSFTGYVSEDDLLWLYNSCSLYVFPSLYEGFGLPVLEAINCGAPVIASNCTSIPEVIGCEEAMFDPTDEADISKKMLLALTDESFRTKIIKKEAKQKDKFSWDKSAQTALNFFAELYSDKITNLQKNKLSSTEIEAEVITEITKIDGVNTLNDAELRNTAAFIVQNYQDTYEKQLFVDISELAQRDAKTGVQRVTRSVLREISRMKFRKFNSKAIYANLSEMGYKYANIFMNKFMCNDSVAPKDDPISFNNGDIFLGLDLQHQIVQYQYNYLKYMHNQGVKIFFVVHDLLPISFPQFFDADMNIVHADWLKVITQFDGILCVSKTTAFELLSWMRLNIPEHLKYCKVYWFHNGADIDNSVPSLGMPDDSANVLAKLSSKPTFLMVGTIEPRKRQDQALDAFEELWSADIDVNLAIVGKIGWMTDELCKRMKSHAEAGKRLFWLEGISDEYLEKVYAASACLIAASEGEGFGLPLIEAAQKKLPIIARDIPVFREVAGEYAFYFSGKSGHDLAEAVKQWLVLYKEGKHPKSDNMPWQTWKESTKQLLHAIGIDEEEGEQNG